ncbi:MAG: phage portal protein, partial [Candidatus Binatia bacterium]
HNIAGEDIKLFDSDASGAGYADFVHQQLLGIGAGHDVPYEFISWDFSKVNDRTLRVVLAEYHRIIEQDRWFLTITQVCMPIWHDFIDYAVMSGDLKAPADFAARREVYSAVLCHPEGWPYLHELQDANAAVVRLKAGLTSRKRELADHGIDVRDGTWNAKKQMGLSEDYGSGPAAGGAPDPHADPNQNDENGNGYANAA